MTEGNCCEGLFCKKDNSDWKEGYCVYPLVMAEEVEDDDEDVFTIVKDNDDMDLSRAAATTIMNRTFFPGRSERTLKKFLSTLTHRMGN